MRKQKFGFYFEEIEYVSSSSYFNAYPTFLDIDIFQFQGERAVGTR